MKAAFIAPEGVTSVAFGGETVNVVDGVLLIDECYVGQARALGCEPAPSADEAE